MYLLNRLIYLNSLLNYISDCVHIYLICLLQWGVIWDQLSLQETKGEDRSASCLTLYNVWDERGKYNGKERLLEKYLLESKCSSKQGRPKVVNDILARKWSGQRTRYGSRSQCIGCVFVCFLVSCFASRLNLSDEETKRVGWDRWCSNTLNMEQLLFV